MTDLLKPLIYFFGLQWPRWPGRSGGEIRDFHLIRHLQLLGRVRYFGAWPDAPSAQEDPLRDGLIGLHVAAPSSATRVFARLGLSHADVRANLTVARSLAEQVEAQSATERPDLVVVSPQMNPVALFLKDRALHDARWVLASRDVEAVRMARLAAGARGWGGVRLKIEAALARRFERAHLRRFDGVIAVSALDARLLTASYGIDPSRICEIPNGVDLDYFRVERTVSRSAPTILFFGALGYPPNDDAAHRLATRILPLVRELGVSAKVTVVGQKPSARLLTARAEDVEIVGEVKDLRPYLASAAIACFPLRAGSGTKIKVLEAWASRLPVVGSPLAAEGFDVRDGEHLLVAESDEALAAAAARLVLDPPLAQTLAVNGRRYVTERHDWRASLSPLGPWLERIVREPHARAPARGRVIS